MDTDLDVQRALGRIEGTQAQILAKLNALTDSFGAHKNDDQVMFSSIRAEFFKKLEDQNESREKHLSDQDEKLNVLKQEADRAKGAGWVILGLLGSLATFVGGAVIAATGGHIKFH